ncbi:MAG: hypothetical protein ACLGXA_15580 [Acidobacteriota bacterium]
MKLFVPALLLAVSAAATVAAAQEYAPPQPAGAAAMEGLMNPASQRAPDQAGCPVMLSSAHLNWPASYLPVTSAEKVTEPNLALGFQNSSGKAIRSVTITARFLGKQSVYQLDASAFDLRLTFSGIDGADQAADQLREIRLPAKMYAYGVTRVSLEQVLFADGNVWTSLGHGNCRLDVQGSAERVQAQ